MLRKHTLALALASTLLFSFAAAPVLAAPPEEAPASSEIVSTVLSWLSQVLGVITGGESASSTDEFGNVIDPGGAKASTPEGGIVIDPGGLANDSDQPRNISVSNEDSSSPEDELGIVIDPSG